MNTRTITIAAAATLSLVAAALPSAAFASDPSAESKPAATQSHAKERRYCVVQQTTGSILDRKVCMTRAEWIARTGLDPAAKK